MGPTQKAGPCRIGINSKHLFRHFVTFFQTFVQQIPRPLLVCFIVLAFYPIVSFLWSCHGSLNTCKDEVLNDVLPINAWELGFAILIIGLIEVMAKIRQDQARGHVHGPAFSSAIDIFGDIHHLISDVMEDSIDDERKNIIKLNEKYKESDTPWKRQLQEEVSRIYSESENYMQRFGAFLASDRDGRYRIQVAEHNVAHQKNSEANRQDSEKSRQWNSERTRQ